MFAALITVLISSRVKTYSGEKRAAEERAAMIRI